MKKIGLVIGQLSYGGAEKQVILLAQGLKGSGKYEPIVFCLSRDIEPNGIFLTENSIEWYVVPDYKGNIFLKALWLSKQTRLVKISILYGFLNVGNVYTAITGLVNRLPYICSIRSANSFLPLWLKTLSKWSCDRADFVIANSTSCVRSLREDLRVQHNRVGIIENALDFLPGNENARETLRAEWGIPKDSIVIGTVSNLKKEKNPFYFIDVFKVIVWLAEKKPLFFVWIGDGPLRHQVDNAVFKLDADIRGKILFLGARSDISNVLKALDVFILTSLYEGMPNAVMEAMAIGLPCVATNVSGTRDILSIASDGEETGILTSLSNPEEFAIAIFGLMANPTRMKKMGESAQKFVQDHYSLEKMVQAHYVIFDEILTHRQIKGETW